MGMRNDSCMTYLYAVVSRQPGGGRCCSSGMSHGFSKEASRCRIEASTHICVHTPANGLAHTLRPKLAQCTMRAPALTKAVRAVVNILFVARCQEHHDRSLDN